MSTALAFPPSPWQVYESNAMVHILDALHCRVAEAHTRGAADAIVAAVNAHDDLVASLLALTTWMREWTGPADGTTEMLVAAWELLDRIGAAPGRETRAPLTEEQIRERIAILFSVDDQRCSSCGRSAVGPFADDPAWFIDSEMHRDGAGHDVELAVIRCPECW
jgi:hypothetical protein